MPSITPRDYQIDFVQRAIIAFEREHNGKGPFRKILGTMGTGGGKTVCFSLLADYALREWYRKPVLILVDQDVLVDQTMDTLFKSADRYGEVLQGARRPSDGAEIIVATMQTMSRRLENYAPDHFQLLIVDEADRSVSPEWQRVLNWFDPHANVCGVTATPDRTDSLNVMNYYEHVFDDVPMFQLIVMGYLVRVMVRTVPLTINLNGVKLTKRDFDERALAEAIVPAFESVGRAIQAFAADRKNLVFHPLRDTSKQFVEVARDLGLNAAHIDGETTNRREMRQRYRDGDIQIMSNALLLTRGFDEPSIDCITVLRPTKSRTLYQQMVGRGTRLYCPLGCPKQCGHPESKKDLLLLDFIFQYEKHGLQTPASLIAGNPRVGAALMRRFQQAGLPLDLMETSDEVTAAVERVIIEEILKHTKDTGRYFDAVELSEVSERVDLQNYTATEEWERNRITAAQAEALFDCGIDIRTVKNYGHAEAILKVAAARSAMGLCSFKQMRLLHRFGFKHLARMTKKKASHFTFLALSKGFRPHQKPASLEQSKRLMQQIKSAITQGSLFD